MIPKIIHYCWFGGKPKPKYLLEYMETWKTNLQSYEIIEWNENNFDVNSFRFTKEASENKKYAFVSDFVRLHALFEHGGIYLDSDVEVLKSFDKFLGKKAFIGFEGDNHVGTAIIGADKNNLFIKTFLDYYKERRFVLDNKEFDQTPNTHIISDILKQKGLLLNDTYQMIDGLFEVFPKEYFSAKSYLTGEIVKTLNTVSIHHFACSWFPWYLKLRIKLSYYIKAIKRNL